MHIIDITLLSGAVFLSHNTQIYHALQSLCLVGISIPSFYIAIVYIDFFAVKAGLMSVTGHTDTASYFSPALCIAIFGIAFYCPLFYKHCKKKAVKIMLFLPCKRCTGIPAFLVSFFTECFTRLDTAFFSKPRIDDCKQRHCRKNFS